jgi:hypothetical protein
MNDSAETVVGDNGNICVKDSLLWSSSTRLNYIKPQQASDFLYLQFLTMAKV